MSVSLTRTKIIVPRRRPEILARPRLLDQLGELLDRKLTILSAPAGYGKTSLLVDLASRAEYTICWYAIDAFDHDPFQFIAYLISALAQKFPRFGQQSLAALESTTGIPFDGNRLVTGIVNEVYETIHEHFVLALDDYHLVDANPAINSFVNELIGNASDNFHFMISTRTLLSLPDLTRMVARGQVGGLGMRDLAFRADEIRALVMQNYHEVLPENAVLALARETEGWITGLVLSAQLGERTIEERARLAHITGVGLYEYLTNQVFEQQTPAIRNFLLQTSLLEEFNAELCQAVFGSPGEIQGTSWDQLIQTVLHNNLFTLPVDDSGTWLRYHHLFRDFLQTRYAREQPQERETLLRKLGAVYTERKEWSKAYQVYQRLGDLSALADLIERAGSSLIRNARLALLKEWLAALPHETLATRPALVSLAGEVEITIGDKERGLELLDSAIKAFRNQKNEAGLARALTRRARLLRQTGKYQQAISDTDEAIAMTAEHESRKEIYAEALRMKGLSLHRMGQWQTAVELLKTANEMYLSLGLAQNVARLQMELGMVYRALGLYDNAEASYHRALDYWRENSDLLDQADVLNSLGVLCHFEGKYEQAHRFLEDALECAHQSGYSLVEAFALASLGDLYFDLDVTTAAFDSYARARALAQEIHNQFLLLYLNVADAALARRRGERERAKQLIVSAENMVREMKSSYEKALYRLEMGRLALAGGDAPQALKQLREAARRFDDSGQRVEEAQSHFYLAAACYQTKNATRARAHFRRSLQLVSTLPSPHALLVATRDAPTFLKAILKDPVIGQSALQLMEQVEQFEHEVPGLRRRLRHQTRSVSHIQPRLTIQGFDRPQVRLDERPVLTSDWQTEVTRDLFFFFLAHPQGLTKESAGEIIWPESTSAQLKLRFKNTMYRLRHAVGEDVILYENEIYRFNRELDYEYDIENFEHYVARALHAADPEERQSHLIAAVTLYRGPYMAGVDGAWVLRDRERLWQIFVQAAIKLAETYYGTRDFDQTLQVVHEIFAQDHSVEEAHRLAMRAYAALGNRTAVVRQFERCRQILQDEIGTSPSLETKELYENLLV